MFIYRGKFPHIHTLDVLDPIYPYGSIVAKNINENA